jgi:prepilin peptidase CpaA
MPIPAVILLFGVFTAALQDVRGRRVSNWISGALAASGLAAWTATLGGRGLELSAAGLVVCLAFALVPFWRGWLGGGDVKLLAAGGAWVGVELAGPLLLLTTAIGGVVSLAALAMGEKRAPYAVAVAAGVTLLLLVEIS